MDAQDASYFAESARISSFFRRELTSKFYHAEAKIRRKAEVGARDSAPALSVRHTRAALPLLIIPVLVILALVALIPISIIQRYRVGTSRQRARGWLVALNLAGLTLSAVLFLISAAFTSIFWVPDALRYTLAGLASGSVLGLIGLWMTRWEPSIGMLHYTPNRLLVLTITLLVTARVLYGFWRGWESWRAGVAGESWFVAAGVAGSMAAGAIVIGYYLTYWIGVRRRLARQLASPLRRIN